MRCKYLKKEYTAADYEEQFKMRIPELLKKIDRIEHIYKKIDNIPFVLYEILEKQKNRLEETRKKHGDYVSPLIFVE